MMNKKCWFGSKKIVSAAAALLIALPASVPCGAQTELKVDYSAEKANITVTVTTDKMEKTAVLSVLADGKYRVLTEMPRTAKNSFVYTAALPADLTSGKYTATVTVGGEVASSEFEHVNLAAAAKAMEKVNASTESTFAGVIREVYRDLAVDVDVFNEHAALMSKLYFQYKPAGNLTAADFSVLYKKCLILCQMTKLTADAEAKAFLEENASKIDFDFAKFSALSAEEQEELLACFRKGNYTEASLETQYQHWFCLADINAKRDGSASSYRTALLDTYASLLKLDVTDFNQSKDPTEVIRLVMGNRYASVKELQTAFYQAVSDVGKKSSSGGGGSSSKSGSSKGSPIINWEPVDDGTDVGNIDAFSDVKSNHWCAGPIQSLYELGVLNGKEAGKFYPEASVTRAEFSKMLIKALFDNYQATTEADFSDVAAQHWFYSDVNAAAELGIINGNGNGSFLPDEVISRQDMAVMLQRALKAANVNLAAGERSFGDDAQIAAYAREAVSSLGSAGILNGMENGNFVPNGAVSRAQAAKALYEVMRAASKL